MAETGAVALNMFGDRKPYQAVARRAFPILVRQAHAGETIFYDDLARELGMRARNMGYPLGSIGQTLLEHGRKRGEKIPPIQCLAVNQKDHVPGEGFGWFMDSDWKRLDKHQRRRLIIGMTQTIRAYPAWDQILEEFGLEPAPSEAARLVRRASRWRGGPESAAHERLKEYVRDHPRCVGLPARARGVVEHRLPSGDRIDVYFDLGDERVAVEVKGPASDEADIARGLFQCVKYTAVLNAVAATEGRAIATRSVLALGGSFPRKRSFRVLRTLLGIEVVDEIDADA